MREKLLQGYGDDEDRSRCEREASGPRFRGERGRPAGCTATCAREGEHQCSDQYSSESNHCAH